MSFELYQRQHAKRFRVDPARAKVEIFSWGAGLWIEIEPEAFAAFLGQEPPVDIHGWARCLEARTLMKEAHSTKVLELAEAVRPEDPPEEEEEEPEERLSPDSHEEAPRSELTGQALFGNRCPGCGYFVSHRGHYCLACRMDYGRVPGQS